MQDQMTHAEAISKIAELAEENERLRNDFCGLATLQFLSDVVTAAGLLRHGKTDKVLAQRISDGACNMRRAATTPNEQGQRQDAAGGLSD